MGDSAGAAATPGKNLQLTRVDLGELRNRIVMALGMDKARRYWDVLKRYIRFKLSKDEMDAGAREILEAENITLHNELIRGIFQNALVGTINPPPQEVPLDDPLDPGRALKKQKLRRDMMGMPGMPGMPDIKRPGMMLQVGSKRWAAAGPDVCFA
jgi:hypothetical protein